MSFILEDGTGSGNRAKVNSSNKIEVESTMHTKAHIASMTDGAAFIANTADTAKTLTTTVTGGPILFLQNNDANNDAILQVIKISVDTTGGILSVYRNASVGTIGNNNIHVPVNLNFGSAKTSSATCYTWNEVGNGMTGISGGTLVESYGLPAAFHVIDLQDTYVLNRTNNVLFNFEGVIAELSIACIFYMHM